MRRKVVLYNPPAEFWTMPLALLAVGSALDRARYRPVVVDGRLDGVDRLLAELEDALCLGVTVLTGAPLGAAIAVSHLVRERYPRLPIVWGGWHPSLFPDDCAAESAVTAAVVGQGEQTFAAIVDRLAAGDDLTGIAGCRVADAGSVSAGPRRDMIDLNRLPRHDYALIDVEAYFNRKRRRQLDYVSSQGCRFRCAFCADPTVFGRSWSGLEPQRVVEEIADLQRRFGCTDVGFQDETFFTSPARVAAIAEGLAHGDLKLTWCATLRADQGRRMDDEVFALCRRSGLRDVVLGLESGSDETLRAIQKDITLDDLWTTADKLSRHGIGASIGVIVGFPDEPEHSVMASLRAATELRRLDPDFRISIFQYQPYPGSPIVNRLRRQGFALPQGLAQWADFDYVGGRSQWLSPDLHRLVDGFNFYQRLAYDRSRHPLARPLAALARWRVARHEYRLPVERKVLERLWPADAAR
jgi:radical SAM superfamily enzyme YgiQ (UPF0313 family)